MNPRTTTHHRRDFLRLASALTCSAGFGAQAQTAGDYKALVCVFLVGGNDGHNMLVPMEAKAYAAYRGIRGGLALPDGTAQLLNVATPGGVPYGLNSGLTAIAPLWGQGKLAAVANVGPLAAPTTRAQVLAGSGSLPSNLYSHSDQILQAQAGNATGSGGTGWAGRTADALVARNGSSRFPAAISTHGNALFCTGAKVASASLIPGFDLSTNGMNVWPDSAAQARAKGLAEVLTLDQGVSLIQAANRVRQDAQTLSQLLRSGGSATLSTAFPGTDLGKQLQQVAQLIKLRATTGMGRQVFFCVHGGFDTHSGQAWQHWDLLRQLGEGLAAFYASLLEMGVSNQVTAFTQSEFGRTLQPSGSGSDHGWGNHQLVLGGAVRGGNVYGRFPYPALSGPDDASDRGVLIPSTSLEQFGGTLARWFGVPEAELGTVFPNLKSFSPADLGFMA
ncbi:DUF1501 domain-containing protein [Roseateles sp.]|uniref:DUF1501 domain-containing protein n=1 Tax=Roseateles sp. TaxID=1971397 RepID=UPI0039277708